MVFYNLITKYYDKSDTFDPTNRFEIEQIITSLKNKNTCAYINISWRLIKAKQVKYREDLPLL